MGPERPPPARHRPGQGPRPARGRLRRRQRRHRRVQQERPRGAQPRARCRLRPRLPSSTSPATTQARSGWTSACARSSAQTVQLDDIDLTVEFAAGEEMRTEISTKFTRERLAAVYAEAGLRARRLVHRRGRRLRAEPRAAGLAPRSPALYGARASISSPSLLRRHDRGEDRQGDAAGDEGVEPLLHLSGVPKMNISSITSQGAAAAAAWRSPALPGLDHRRRSARRSRASGRRRRRPGTVM